MKKYPYFPDLLRMLNMNIYTLGLIMIFSCLSVTGQTRQMSIQIKHSPHVVWIKENQVVAVKLTNGNNARGRIAFLNDSQFYINNDTINLDSIKRFMNIKNAKFVISPDTFPLKWDMYIQRKDKKHLRYKITERHFVTVRSESGDKYKGKISIINDSQFIIKGHTINIDKVAKIKKIKKSNLILRTVFTCVGPPVAAGGILILSSVESQNSWSVGEFITALIGGIIVVEGAGLTIASGVLYLTHTGYHKIDGNKRKLYIKANNKRTPAA